MNVASIINAAGGTTGIQSMLNGQTVAGTKESEDMFSSILKAAIDNVNNTNDLLSAAENEEIKWALGESENTHQLTIALQKASTALQYTVAVRDKFMEAYKEIMQLQI